MPRKRTRAQKRATKLRLHQAQDGGAAPQPVVTASESLTTINQDLIKKDLWKTIVISAVIGGILLGLNFYLH